MKGIEGSSNQPELCGNPSDSRRSGHHLGDGLRMTGHPKLDLQRAVGVVNLAVACARAKPYVQAVPLRPGSSRTHLPLNTMQSPPLKRASDQRPGPSELESQLPSRNHQLAVKTNDRSGSINRSDAVGNDAFMRDFLSEAAAERTQPRPLSLK